MMMTQRSDSYKSHMLLSLFIGAAAGALLVALNTHKTDLELQRQAKALARSAKRGSAAVAEDIDGLMEDWKERSALAAGDPKRGGFISVDDLPG
jgi:hypothetical protein